MSKRKQVQVPIEKIQEQDRFIEAIAEKNSRFYTSNKAKVYDTNFWMPNE